MSIIFIYLLIIHHVLFSSQNIELKVELESVKNELTDKQELLKKAS